MTHKDYKDADLVWIEDTIRFLLETWWKIDNNRIIFFLGSGFSSNFRVKNWHSFVSLLLCRLIEKAKKIESGEIEIEQPSKYDSSILNLDIKIKNLENLWNRLQKNANLNLDIFLEKIFFVIEIKSNRKKFEEQAQVGRVSDNIFYNTIKETYLECFKINENEIKTDKLLIDAFKKIGKKIITTNYDSLLQYKSDQWSAIDENKFSLDSGLVDNLLSSQNKFFLPIHGHVFNHYFQDINHSIWEKCNPNTDCEDYMKFLQNGFPIVDSFNRFNENYQKEGDPNNLRGFLAELIEKSIELRCSIIFIGYSFDDSFVTDSLLDSLSDLNDRTGSKYLHCPTISPPISILKYDIPKSKKDLDTSNPIPNHYFLKNISIYNILRLKDVDLLSNSGLEVHNDLIPSDGKWLSIIKDLHDHNKHWFEEKKVEIKSLTDPMRCNSSTNIMNTLEDFLFYLEVEKLFFHHLRSNQTLNNAYIHFQIKSINLQRNKNYLFIVALIWQITFLSFGSKSELEESIRNLLEIFFENPRIEEIWQNDFLLFATGVENDQKSKIIYWLNKIESLFFENEELVKKNKRAIYHKKIADFKKKLSFIGGIHEFSY